VRWEPINSYTLLYLFTMYIVLLVSYSAAGIPVVNNITALCFSTNSNHRVQFLAIKCTIVHKKRATIIFTIAVAWQTMQALVLLEQRCLSVCHTLVLYQNEQRLPS